MFFTNGAILPAYGRMVDLSHELDLRILERIVVEFEIDNILASLVWSVDWTVKC